MLDSCNFLSYYFVMFEIMRGPKRQAAIAVSAVGLLASGGCGGESYTQVHGASPEDLDLIVSPYSDFNEYNFADFPKTDIKYHQDGSRTYSVETKQGPVLRAKEECGTEGELYTILPYKGIFKYYAGRLDGYKHCEDDGKLTPNEFKGNS